MEGATPFGLIRMASRTNMETFVTVDKATELQNLSMQRFQTEAAHDQKLSRILGHISINRRSTEVIKTAMFEEEMMAEVEEQVVYDEDAVLCDLVPDVGNSPPSPRLDAMSDDDADQWTELPPQVGLIAPLFQPFIGPSERYQPESSDVIMSTSNDEIVLDMEQDWMYDVLNLQIDYNALVNPKSKNQLPRDVAVTVWRMILESLAVFTKKKPEIDSMYDIRELEAYGSPKPDHPVGLGLHCNQSQYGTYGVPLQLAM